MAATAADQVAQVAGEVTAQARNLLDESKNQLRTQAQTQTDQIASKLRELGDQVQALVEGRTSEAGPVGDYARQAGQTVAQFAGRIEERGFDGVIDDVQRFARRKPGVFLLGAAAAGFGVGRLLRAGGLSSSQQQSTSPSMTATSAAPPLVDVRDGAVTALTTSDDPLAADDGYEMPQTLTSSTGGANPSPLSSPTDPRRIR